MFKSRITKKEKRCLVALKEICRKYEMDNIYSIGETCEQRVCMCKRKGIWEVFIVERGIEFEKHIYEECIDACVSVLEYCSYCTQELEDALRDFRNILKINIQNKTMIKKQCKL